MAGEWPVLSLREAGVQLLDCEHRTPPPAEAGYPYVAIPQVKDGRLDLSEARLISHDHFIEWTRKARPQKWDVILSRRCNPGETAVVPSGLQCALGQNLVLLRADGKGVLPEFLRWLVRGPEWWEQVQTFINVGAVFDSLKCADIPNFRLPIPPLEDQRAIAHILGTLDDKIELNRRMNETLEAMARGFFKSWFVDGEKPIGIDAATVTLFPDSFQDSPMGKIPKGWRVAALPEVIEINPPRQLSKGQISPYVDMQNMPTHGHRPIDWINRPFGSGMRFKNGDTLVARITPCLENGKTAFVDFLEDDQVGWGSTEYIVVRPKEPLPVEYGYYLARSEDFRNHAIQNMTGSSGRQRVPVECFSKYLIAVPSGAVAQRFGELVNPLMETIRANDNQSRTLAAIRDALLPKLLSGEIRIQDNKKLQEAPA